MVVVVSVGAARVDASVRSLLSWWVVRPGNLHHCRRLKDSTPERDSVNRRGANKRLRLGCRLGLFVDEDDGVAARLVVVVVLQVEEDAAVLLLLPETKGCAKGRMSKV